MSQLSEFQVAESAWEKVRATKRFIGNRGLRGGLALAREHGLLPLSADQVPESVRADLAFLSEELGALLHKGPAGDLEFVPGISDATVEAIGSAFWRIYDAVNTWYTHLGEKEWGTGSLN